MIKQEMIDRSINIKNKYRQLNKQDGHKSWTVTDYMSGFVKDVGDLSKLIMIKQGLRGGSDNIDHDLEHEIGDCFWSLFVICDELGIKTEKAIETMLRDLESRFKEAK